MLYKYLLNQITEQLLSAMCCAIKKESVELNPFINREVLTKP